MLLNNLIIKDVEEVEEDIDSDGEWINIVRRST